MKRIITHITLITVLFVTFSCASNYIECSQDEAQLQMRLNVIIEKYNINSRRVFFFKKSYQNEGAMFGHGFHADDGEKFYSYILDFDFTKIDKSKFNMRIDGQIIDMDYNKTQFIDNISIEIDKDMKIKSTVADYEIEWIKI